MQWWLHLGTRWWYYEYITLYWYGRIRSSGTIASLLISLYMTQDSFGTAANVSSDNAIALVIDKIYRTKLAKSDTE